MNARQVLGQINAEMYAGRGDTCPNCRQLNAKVSGFFISSFRQEFRAKVFRCF